MYKSKKWLTSDRWVFQYIGAALHKGNSIICLLLLLCVLWALCILLRDNNLLPEILCFIPDKLSFIGGESIVSLKTTYLVFSVLLCLLTGFIIHYLTPIFCLRKQESRITWSQILFLASIGNLIIAIIESIPRDEGGIKETPEYYVLLIGGALLSWIFQDTIKSVVAFFYLRINGLLKIDDWIIVPSHNIDGVVKNITLTTVTIENWDTTISAFPTYILHAEHFQNLQNMLDGKTHGRQMIKTFVIDTGWIHPLKEAEIQEIRKHANDALRPFVDSALSLEKLNITAFREYVYQMLLTNPSVSHHPRLLVRWLEQKNEGMPLQLYAYITKTNLDAFEWEQSQIIEQVIEALSWFGLQLYQSASGFDASNGNIYLSQQPAKYEKEYEKQ